MTDVNKRESWIEPTIETLEIEETNAILGKGPDGGDLVDCTKS